MSANFFGTDTEDGEDNFMDIISSADPSAVFYQYEFLTQETPNPVTVEGTDGSTVYVKISRNNNVNDYSYSVGHYGTTYFMDGWEVEVSQTASGWNEAVEEGVKFEFFLDAAMQTPTTMNAFGTFTYHWGTCCTSQDNPTPTGTSEGSAIYSVFTTADGTNSINQVANIPSTISADVHFLAEIDDSDLFTSVTLAPNGNGEFFAMGGYLLFSQVNIGSIPAGSGWTPSIAPSIVFNPEDGATDVAVDSNITLTFSEVIRKTDDSELTDSNVDYLIDLRNSNSNGDAIAFDATINATKTVITIIPANDFLSEQVVYVGIGATVEDQDNNPITASSITFTTLNSQTSGCTDSEACNYDESAISDDGSCDFSCLDCAGVPNGNTVFNECGYCENGLLFDLDHLCLEGCDGQWYLLWSDEGEEEWGSGFIPGLDEDGNCCFFDEVDCNNICNGDGVLDNCGICDNDPSNDCVQDCSGTWGGGAGLDGCGCTDSQACNYDEAALGDDGSCEYHTWNYDCEGFCAFEVDCEGYCGGTNWSCLELGMELEISSLGLFTLVDWYGGNTVAELTIYNPELYSMDFSISYGAYVIHDAGYSWGWSDYILGGKTGYYTLLPGDSLILSNINIDPYFILEHYQDTNFIETLQNIGYLINGNYSIEIQAYGYPSNSLNQYNGGWGWGSLLANVSINENLNCSVIDCNGVCGGGAVVDECGVCGGNGWDECDTDNDGISNLEQWGYGAYNIDVADVPEDQGGWVNMSFNHSFYDTDTIITRSELYTIELLDSNTWVVAQSFGAYGAETYSVLLPTMYNNDTTQFRIISNMDEGNFLSYENGFGASIDNIDPAVPTGLMASMENESVVLSWDQPVDADFQYFTIYRNDEFIEYSTESTYTENEYGEFGYYITATDANGNESDASESLNIQSYMLGDINYDGGLNVLDVVTLCNIVLTQGAYDVVGDMNGDGVLSILDIVTLIHQILNGE